MNSSDKPSVMAEFSLFQFQDKPRFINGHNICCKRISVDCLDSEHNPNQAQTEGAGGGVPNQATSENP